MTMVRGAISQSGADIAMSITAIVGPTGGTTEKPVGVVCFGFFIKNNWPVKIQFFQGERRVIVNQSADYALNHLISSL